MIKKVWSLLPKEVKFIFLKRYEFKSNIFDRVRGLDFILEKSKNKKILDFGCEQGLVDYEFARAGASVIHGFEINKKYVHFANLLFERVPTKGKFMQANLTESIDKINKRYKKTLLKKYDIVLYLGIYNHLREYMSKKELGKHISFVIKKADEFLVVRDDFNHEFEELIFKANFKKVYTFKEEDKNLNIYQKK